jgi:hypothetical protein
MNCVAAHNLRSPSWAPSGAARYVPPTTCCRGEDGAGRFVWQFREKLQISWLLRISQNLPHYSIDTKKGGKTWKNHISRHTNLFYGPRIQWFFIISTKKKLHNFGTPHFSDTQKIYIKLVKNVHVYWWWNSQLAFRWIPKGWPTGCECQWIGFVGKILTGNPWFLMFLPSNIGVSG